MVKATANSKAYTSGLIAGLLTAKMVKQKNKRLKAKGLSGGKIKMKEVLMALSGPVGWKELAERRRLKKANEELNAARGVTTGRGVCGGFSPLDAFFALSGPIGWAALAAKRHRENRRLKRKLENNGIPVDDNNTKKSNKQPLNADDIPLPDDFYNNEEIEMPSVDSSSGSKKKRKRNL